MERVLPVIVPVFAVIAAGYAAAWRGLIGPAAGEGISRFVYYFALPSLIFVTLAGSSIERILEGGFLASLSAGLLVPGFLYAAAARLLGSRGRGGVSLLLTGYPNIGYMGIPFFLTAFGPEGTVYLMTGVALQNILIIPIAVSWMEAGSGGGEGGARSRGILPWRILANPLIYSVVAGVAFAATGWALPPAVEKPLRLLGAAAGAGGLFCVGLSLWGKPLLPGGVREVAPVLAIKLAVAPIAAWYAAVLGEVAPLTLLAAVFASAMPIGANSFILSQNCGQPEEVLDLMGSSILLSTLFSLFTLSFLLWLFPAP